MNRPFGLALFALVAAMLVVVVGACGDDDDGGPRIVLALARGGLGDRAFNDSANAGLVRAANELDAEVSTLAFADGDAQVTNLAEAADGDFDLLIALGSENVAPLAAAAAAHPDKRFAIIDAVVDAPNVTSVTFRELEGDYLVGALGALLSDGGAVGFLGGADVDVIRRIEHGWREGVLATNPDAELLVDYVAGRDDFSGFANPDLAREKTAALYDAGARVVYAAAGGSTLGAIEAAETAGALIITTGSDQRHLAPGVVVTSRIKDMGSVVFLLAEETAAGDPAPATRTLDLASGAIALAPYDGPLVPGDVRAEFDAIVQAVESGDVTVAEYAP